MTAEEIMELADRYALHHTVNYKTSSLTRNSLQSKVEALVRDAERLDYLDKQASFYNGVRMCCLPGGLRQAIDAAIAAQEMKHGTAP